MPIILSITFKVTLSSEVGDALLTLVPLLVAGLVTLEIRGLIVGVAFKITTSWPGEAAKPTCWSRH